MCSSGWIFVEMIPSVLDHRDWSFIPLIQMIQIMLRFPDHYVGKQQHGDQVGNGHQGVQGVCDAPHQLQLDHRGDHQDQNPGHAVGDQPLFTGQVFQAALSIVGPA